MKRKWNAKAARRENIEKGCGRCSERKLSLKKKRR
jgi:hypothetical protein